MMTQPHYIDREAVAATCHKLLCDELGLHPDEAAESAGVFADAIISLSAPMEAVAWRVKDYADGWILFHNEAPARKSGEARNGALVQALAVIPTEGLGSSSPKSEDTHRACSSSHRQPET